MKSDPTFPKRIASIDIGTNTILLLIAKVEGGKIRPLLEMETVVRLGEGLQKNETLLKGAMNRGLQTLTQYLKLCQSMEVQKIFAAGTSALREAKNSEDFLKGAKEKLNLSIEIISEEEEAQLSFLAVAKDLGEVNLSTPRPEGWGLLEVHPEPVFYTRPSKAGLQAAEGVKNDL